jgi:aminotransferase
MVANKIGLEVSQRCGAVSQSEIRAMSVECEKHGGINLAQGVCDVPLPDPVRRGAQKAIDDGCNTYTRHDGLAELRTAIAGKVKSFNGITCDPETEVVVTSGSTGAFMSACMALLDPGDEVILFEPTYGYHVTTLLSVGVNPVYVTLRGREWSFFPADLKLVLTDRTKGILVNTPANPSGKVFTFEELSWIADFARENDLFVFTDEIYEYIVYGGGKHISPATLPGMAERTITISGYSKTFSITGWRVGYCVADRRWAQMIGYMHDLVYVCAPSPLQRGVADGIVALAKSDYYEKLLADLTEKRDLICRTLRGVGLIPHVPYGAYYVLADVSRLAGSTSKERAMGLLRQTGVACVPGEAFFHDPSDGFQLARFCFAKTTADLQEACQRLSRLV